MRIRRGVAAAILIAAIAAGSFLTPQPARGQLFDEERVRAAAVLGSTPLVQGAEVRAAVAVKVGRGFHVNANPASEDFLIATEVGVTAPGIEVVDVFYPPPIEQTFGFWPESLKVWEGDVVVGVVLRVTDAAAAGDANLDFVVAYQACNDEACFAPAEATATVPTSIAPAGTTSRAVESPLLDAASFGEES
ncbi:MAG: hypothetical protein GKS06_11920 [Acidobacteria bacterium]|nr:hypothetical protein [Acidobacteriota bacterium]